MAVQWQYTLTHAIGFQPTTTTATAQPHSERESLATAKNAIPASSFDKRTERQTALSNPVEHESRHPSTVVFVLAFFCVASSADNYNRLLVQTRSRYSSAYRLKVSTDARPHNRIAEPVISIQTIYQRRRKTIVHVRQDMLFTEVPAVALYPSLLYLSYNSHLHTYTLTYTLT